MRTCIEQLAKASEAYLDALHSGDTGKLQDLFLPEARLSSSIDGVLSIMEIRDYIQMVGERVSPRSEGHPNTGEIISIDVSGPSSAVVKAHLSVPPKRFVDFLSFLKIKGQWRIIAKVYHAEE